MATVVRISLVPLPPVVMPWECGTGCVAGWRGPAGCLRTPPSLWPGLRVKHSLVFCDLSLSYLSVSQSCANHAGDVACGALSRPCLRAAIVFPD